MFRWLLCFPISIIACCNSPKKIKDNIEIIIEDETLKYDLKAKTYTVYRYKGDTTINFTLTKLEKEKIINYYYSLKLDELPDKLNVEDNCSIMPAFYSTLIVKSKTQSQEIIIDTNCKSYKGLFDTQGKRVTLFIDSVRNIINSKPEIRHAPKSDYIFM